MRPLGDGMTEVTLILDRMLLITDDSQNWNTRIDILAEQHTVTRLVAIAGPLKFLRSQYGL